MMIMSVNVKMRPKSSATRLMGRISGSVTWKKLRQKPAPSTAAASWMSCGIEPWPASRITVASGSCRQTWTALTAPLAHREGRPPEPHEARAVNQPRHAQRPVEHAVGRVEDPEPGDRADRDRRDPRQQDEEAHQLLAAEVALQRERKRVAEHDDDRLRDQREHERVLERGLEPRRADHAGEVAEADVVHRLAARRRVAEAVVERHQERKADQQRDV